MHGTVVQIVTEKMTIEYVRLFKYQKTAKFSPNVSSKLDMK